MTESCVESQNRECGASHGDEGIEATHFDLTVADSVDEVVERDTPQDVEQQAERSHQYSECRTQRVSDRSEDDASSFSSSQIRPLVREKKGRTHVKLMMKHQIAQVFR